jgi:hypothetical protein
MAYQNKWTEDGLYRTFTKITSGKEVLDSNLSIQGDSRFDDIKYVINDFTRTVEFDVTEYDIKKIVVIDNVAAISKPALRIAIVATLQPLLDWIDLYCKNMQGSAFQCEMFENKDDAYGWVANEIQ